MQTYRFTNTLNGKFYIGSTCDFERRKKDHLSSKKNYPFQNALRKNPEAFEIEVWEDDSDEPVLEQALLDMWFGTEQCYNLNPRADIPPQVEWSEERKKKHSERLSKRFKGVPKPPEQVAKMIQSKTGKPLSAEGKKNIARARLGNTNRLGKKDSEETKAKKRESKRGYRHWVNRSGETRMAREKPEGEWQNGRVWRQG